MTYKVQRLLGTTWTDAEQTTDERQAVWYAILLQLGNGAKCRVVNGAGEVVWPDDAQ